MTIERINYLFENGFITEEEHNELIDLNVNKYEKNSIYSYLILILAFIGWFLMLTFTRNGKQISLLSSGEQRLWAGGIFSTLSVAVFILANSENKFKDSKENYAYMGIGVAIAILTIIIPVLFMLM